MTSAPHAPDVEPEVAVAAATLPARVADVVVDAVLWVAHVVAQALRSVVVRVPRRPFDRVGHRVWLVVTRALRLRPDVVTNPLSLGMRRLAIMGVVVNVFIVASGGLVRLTKSGLGCPTWPRCTEASLLPRPEADIPLHQMLIEFGNRILTFAVLLVAVLVFIAALHLRTSRPDLVRLAVVQPLGVLAQILLGGVTVLTGLHPASVGAHYLLSSLVIVACVALHVRVIEGDRPSRRTLPTRPYQLLVALPVLGFLVLAAGTVVTGAGPHAGDESAPRYTFLGVDTVVWTAKAHAALVWLTVLAVVGLVVLARRAGQRVVVRRTYVLLAVIGLQGLLGYVQYFTGVPGPLVFFHVLGSALFWAALLYTRFAARDRGPAEPVPADASVAQPVRSGG